MSGVAFKQMMLTNHSKTVYDLITSFRNSLMQVNNYRNERAADIMVAKALNFDIHMELRNGVRRISRITEIIPDESQDYPYTEAELSTMNEGAPLMDMTLTNANEYFKRSTDRVSFKSRDLIVFDKETDSYKLLGLPSEEKQEEMMRKMSMESKAEIGEDLADLRAAYYHLAG